MQALDIERTTALLRQLSNGDGAAAERLLKTVYAELRRVAGGRMKERDPGHTLQPTALVHEAWIRLIASRERTYENRGHFLGVAAKAMRSVLVDHVRAKRARKRGGDYVAEALDEAVAIFEGGDTDLLDLEEALALLEREDP